MPHPSSSTASAAASNAWLLDLWRRTWRLWWLKTLGATIFMTGFFTVYLHVLKHPAFAVTTMPLTAVDRAIPFQASTLPLYLSLWFYVSLPMAPIQTWTRLSRYGLAMGGLCVTGLICFFFFPTAVPLLDVDWGAHAGFAALHSIDSAGNACPSLHVAAAVCAAGWMHRQLEELGAGPVVRLANLLWCIGIVYSTLATKQHVSLDVLAGTILGLIAVVLSLPRQVGATSAASRGE